MTNDPAPRETSIEASGPRSIAAHTITTAHSGDIIELPAEVLNAARDVQPPPGASNLPPRGLCLGREDELAWLERTLASDGETAITQAPAVHGLGGVGKSTLALHYAHRHRSDHTVTWWITADSPARIEQSLAGLALRLFPAWAGKASEQERAAWALTWLQWHPGWLLVFDNVDDPRDLDPYAGALSGGHLLATSRRATGWPRTVPALTLGTLPPDEAAQLLCTYALDAPPGVRQLQDARTLAAELGHLPLALEQAGAYLHQNPTISIDAYRRRLGTKLDKAADGIDAERTIARIWTHTLQALTTRNPLAVTILHTLAWLAPDNIPHTLLQTPNTDEDDLAEALGNLRAYSMISITPGGAGVSVHRLVQTVLRHNATAGEGRPPTGRREAEKALIHALANQPTPDTGPAAEWDALMPHLIALAATSPHNHRDDAVTDLYLTAAQYLDQQGHNARTIPLREAVLTQRERDLGDTHPRTLTSRNNLAGAYEAAGDLTHAIPLYETTLTQSEQILGDTHPHTLSSRNNLAYAYESAGDLDRAIPLYETTLTQREQILGNTHPATLTSRNNLAHAYESAGDLARAIPLYETTLTQREQVLGNTHPATLSSRNNLARAYRAAGDLARAIPLLETVLTQRVRALGDTHPQTLTSRNNLAHAYESAGDLARAIPLYETTVAQCEQILGDTHPHTLSSRNNLAHAYLSAGDLTRAIPLYETTLTQREQILGNTHPATLTSRNNLAYAYESAGDLTRAIPLYETTVAQCEQILGDTHPLSLTSRNNLAGAYRVAGDLARAIPLLETVLTHRERVLGDTHPATESTRRQLREIRSAHVAQQAE
ncbi:FxSxx-COOH system tetratricopeptide repeat protein [Streptacidiphilus griseoplanus]|uniref:FxSxx-COOH system tetratricopeptide repeat protein n=1 Tax=Peterkaempfera griseoplana TaxID=66896 RepID=UPI000B10824D|nr:FxSxx-COOH system tetratricopeptide repeat protein [Peterkaempfera griseoplana]